MSYTTTYMGLTVWNLLSDLFDHTQLEGDLIAIDGHDHTNGHGKQIPTGGIADGSITDGKIAAATITGDKIATGTITGANITDGTITASDIANDTITWQQILSFLEWVSTSTSATAAPGTVVNYNGAGAGTITLPSANTNTHAVIGVKCAFTGAVTVATTSGQKILGLGTWPGVTSISLATVGAYALFMSDGAFWNIISGQQDTGWLPLTNFHSSVGSLPIFTNTTPAARLVGDKVSLRGNLFTTNVVSIGPNAWAFVPTALRPSYDVWFPGGNNVWGSSPGPYPSEASCQVASAAHGGGISYDPNDAETGANPVATVYLDGVNWTIP